MSGFPAKQRPERVIAISGFQQGVRLPTNTTIHSIFGVFGPIHSIHHSVSSQRRHLFVVFHYEDAARAAVKIKGQSWDVCSLAVADDEVATEFNKVYSKGNWQSRHHDSPPPPSRGSDSRSAERDPKPLTDNGWVSRRDPEVDRRSPPPPINRPQSGRDSYIRDPPRPPNGPGVDSRPRQTPYQPRSRSSPPPLRDPVRAPQRDGRRLPSPVRPERDVFRDRVPNRSDVYPGGYDRRRSVVEDPTQYDPTHPPSPLWDQRSRHSDDPTAFSGYPPRSRYYDEAPRIPYPAPRESSFRSAAIDPNPGYRPAAAVDGIYRPGDPMPHYGRDIDPRHRSRVVDEYPYRPANGNGVTPSIPPERSYRTAYTDSYYDPYVEEPIRRPSSTYAPDDYRLEERTSKPLDPRTALRQEWETRRPPVEPPSRPLDYHRNEPARPVEPPRRDLDRREYNRDRRDHEGVADRDRVERDRPMIRDRDVGFDRNRDQERETDRDRAREREKEREQRDRVDREPERGRQGRESRFRRDPYVSHDNGDGTASVFVSNLPPTVVESRLREIFGRALGFENVLEMNTGRAGFGFVRVRTPAHAELAVKRLHHAKYERHPMNVTIGKPPEEYRRQKQENRAKRKAEAKLNIRKPKRRAIEDEGGEGRTSLSGRIGERDDRPDSPDDGGNHRPIMMSTLESYEYDDESDADGTELADDPTRPVQLTQAEIESFMEEARGFAITKLERDATVPPSPPRSTMDASYLSLASTIQETDPGESFNSLATESTEVGDSDAKGGSQEKKRRVEYF